MAAPLFQWPFTSSGGSVAALVRRPSRVATDIMRPQRGARTTHGEPSLMSLGQELAPHLPFLRRYARALTGSQAHGDAFVRATLEAIVAQPDEFPRDVDPRLGLYRTFHAIWSTANVEEGEEPTRDYSGAEGIAQARLSRITPLSRQALLLTSLEGFSSQDAGLSDQRQPAGRRQPGRRSAGRDRAPDARRRSDHRGRADHRHGHRDHRA